MPHQPFVLSLSAEPAALGVVGGKGRALMQMTSAGLPVPGGFCVSTAAYRATLAEDGIDASGEDPAGLRRQLVDCELPKRVADEIAEALEQLGDVAVSVRSSATAEDLPELSFAGQQDTFLGVRGVADVLDAVRACWASLFNDRAVSYRRQQGVDEAAIAMAVVVQQMVPSDVSGVLFTANPATGERSELVVNASWGLGETIVSGAVTPDEFVLDRESLDVRASKIGSKVQQIRMTDSGVAASDVATERRLDASLDEEQLQALGRAALQSEAVFDDVPQDIEWAFAGGALWLLQSRPITSLPPAPLSDVEWLPPNPGGKLIRRQVVEHMPGPLTPLFEDLYLADLDASLDDMLDDFGITIDIGQFVDRPLFVTVNGFAYCQAAYRFSLKFLKDVPGLLAAYYRMFRHWLPNLVDIWRTEKLPAYQRVIAAARGIDVETAADAELLQGVRDVSRADARYWFAVTMVIGMAKVADAALDWFLSKTRFGSGHFLRGYASRTLESDRRVEAIARRVHASPVLTDLLSQTTDGRFVEAARLLEEGAAIADEIDRYRQDFGHRIYSLDFGDPTEGEDTAELVASLRAIVAAGTFDVEERHRRVLEARKRAIEEAFQTFGGIRLWLFRRFHGLARRYVPFREDAFFHVGAGWPVLRRLALALGERFARRGLIDRATDVFYLTAGEVESAIAGTAPPDLPGLAASRRDLRAARQRLHAPGMVPEGSEFRAMGINLRVFETQKRNPDAARTLEGFAVSPGRVTGVACVLHSHEDFAEMQDGAILVCPTTTPAWTPLFPRAIALVTDIGGILAHGSIVAREYGIPAVLGTGNGTRQIRTGQRIVVDGDLGKVEVLDPA